MKIRSLVFFVFIFFVSPSLTFKLNAQAVVANFSASSTQGCAPLSVNFTDLSTGSPTAWAWSFGNGNTAATQNPSATYLTPGTYTITLTASKPGSSSNFSISITVFSKPVADFTSNVTTTTCIGDLVTFTDASTPGGGTLTTWNWDFGDGSTQITSNGIGTHTYSTAGTYPVSLLLFDNNGCSGSIIKNIIVLPAPAAAFSGSPLHSCIAPLTVTFTNSSAFTGTVTYIWDFGDGGSSTLVSPAHTYNSTGTYTVTLVIVQGACTDTIVKNNYVVIEDMLADFSVSNDSICLGQSVTFTDVSTPLSVSRTWDFGDGSTSTIANPSHIYAAAGTYTVSLLNATDPFSCSDSEIKVGYITVFPIAVAAFTANNTAGCAVPFTVNFTDNSTNATTWSWNFGDGATSLLQNPSHVYTLPGTYTVTLIASNANGCSNTIIKTNYIVISLPVANLTATPRNGCVPLTVNFTSTSTSSIDPIANYNWNFGDGTIINTAVSTTSNVYNLPGVYTVTLIITTTSGCLDTIIMNNYIRTGTTPTANFSVVDRNLCHGAMATFTDLSVGADSAYWKFGLPPELAEGTFSTPSGAVMPYNPVTSVFPDTGTFSVMQIVYYNGCPDTLILNDTIRILPPKPLFNYRLNCSNYYTVTFADTSWGATTCDWYFGDGNSLLAQPPLTPFTHTYLTRGTYTVNMVAHNSVVNCQDSITHTFTIAEPLAQFTTLPVKGCYPLPVSISNTSQDASALLWDFGDGTATSNLVNPPVHTFALPATDTVVLIITDVNGCKDTTTQQVVVQGPVPLFTADTLTGCTPLLVTFADTSISDSTLTNWTWNFGDGTAVQNTNNDTISHTYFTPGLYTVTMTVTDINLCTKTIVKTNYIQPTFPSPSFTLDTFACRGDLLTFNATATSAVGPGVIYSWNFGDGTNGNGLIVTHSYALDNLYAVTLTVTDKNGCDSSLTQTVLIQKPVAGFKDTVLLEGCGFANIQFTDTSAGTSINSWQWNFGDGGSSTSPDPTHTYTVPGMYTVSLIVTNAGGCIDTVSLDSIVIVPGPFGTFSFTPNSGCRPLEVTFTSFSDNSTSYIWDFGDGTVVPTTDTTITHIYTNDIVATPILLMSNTLSDSSTCQLAAPSAGQINVSTLINVTIDSSVVTLDQDEAFTILSTVGNVTGVAVYSWSPADGLSCTTCQTPIIVGNGSGQTVTYTLTVTDPTSGSCIGDDIINIIFTVCENDISIPNVFTPNGDEINDYFDIKGTCESDSYLFRIYDRWGIKVFTSEFGKLSWDGRTTSGMEAVEGVYYYVLQMNDKFLTGFLQLIR
ncbi:MAG: hypothetical protein A3F72_16190 [Bacteroidetes bacterium RIFCSPLOWO2_12_FULL_35_15]|nr:MAG: hypothetical protein A3F72_16190 [Bacteroidetes bacterium RIFCSPLOWO2_12_FULL_35_15]